MIRLLQIFVFLFVFTTVLNCSTIADPILYKVNQDTVEFNTPILIFSSNIRSWRNIEYFIEHTNYKTYVLDWAGYGGDVYLGQQFADVLLDAEANGKKIIIKLIGNAYSEQALLVCVATELQNPMNKFLMFHADSYGYGITQHIVLRKDSHILNQLTICENRGILKQEDEKKIWEGLEVYIDNNHVWYERDRRIK